MTPGRSVSPALGAVFRRRIPLRSCDKASPRPTDGEDTQGRSLVRFALRAFALTRLWLARCGAAYIGLDAAEAGMGTVAA